MKKKYRVTLTSQEREQLREMIGKGKAAARKLTHARILLQTDQSPDGLTWKDQQVADGLGVTVVTVERVRRRFVEEGFEAAVSPRPTSRVYERKLDGVAEARLIALACSQVPEGRSGWTLRLLADRMVVLEYVDSLSYETVRRTLKKTS